MTCTLCGIRKPRRECPGVHGEICTVCCGTEREQSIDCPLSCPWLHEAHEHERAPDLDPATVPNQDITVTEEFLQENEVLLAFLAIGVYEGAIEVAGATDYDVREGLAALVATWKTLQSGIYYETVPANTFAAAIAGHVHTKIEDVREKEAESLEIGTASSISDSAILAVLAFLQRLEYSRNNGRKRSRAFLDFLQGFYVPSDEETGEAPDEPMVIL